MTNKVSQDYFNSIVAENIEVFTMNEDEAINEAINQLQSQNIDLTTICKFSLEEQDLLLNTIKELQELLDSNEINETFKKCLQIIKLKFDKHISFKCLASNKSQAYNLFQLLLTKINDKDLLLNILDTYNSFITNQSDILQRDGIRLLIQLLEKYSHDKELLILILKCLNSSCILCESNRQMYVENSLCEQLLELFKVNAQNESILIAICQLIRSLLLDDDLRVEISKSHEHAKYIVSELNGIDTLLRIGLTQNVLSEDTLGHIMLTLSKLAVRNEFCQEICDKGGLKFVIKCISQEHLCNLVLLKSALNLLKSICNNDSVKHETTKLNGIYLLCEIFNKYISNSNVCELGCACLATILLRNLDACEQLFSLNGDLLLLQVLNIHFNKSSVMKFCCMAIRNLVSRNKKLGEKLVANNIEELLRKVYKQNDRNCSEEAKAALRDLNLQVDLKELWTGSGKQLEY